MEQVIQLDLNRPGLPVSHILQDVQVLGLAVRAGEVGQEVLGERSVGGEVRGLHPGGDGDGDGDGGGERAGGAAVAEEAELEVAQALP